MDLYIKLSSSMEQLSSTFSSRMQQHEEDLKNAISDTATHKTVASLSREFTEFKSLIWKTMGILKSQMELLIVGLDRHENASRAKVLLLHGMSEDKDANLRAGVLSILSQRMDLSTVAESDITSCHWLGSNTNKPRLLLVRFVSREVRGVVWRSKSKLKGTGLTWSEFLTSIRHQTFMEARKFFGMKRCWSSDGKIIIQVSDKSRRKIESAGELRQLMAKFPVAETIDNETTGAKTTSSAVDKRQRKLLK